MISIQDGTMLRIFGPEHQHIVVNIIPVHSAPQGADSLRQLIQRERLFGENTC